MGAVAGQGCPSKIRGIRTRLQTRLPEPDVHVARAGELRVHFRHAATSRERRGVGVGEHQPAVEIVAKPPHADTVSEADPGRGVGRRRLSSVSPTNTRPAMDQGLVIHPIKEDVIDNTARGGAV